MIRFVFQSSHNYHVIVSLTAPVWSDWSSWSDCFEVLGQQMGFQNRSRECNTTKPLISGFKFCNGSYNGTQSCEISMRIEFYDQKLTLLHVVV